MEADGYAVVAEDYNGYVIAVARNGYFTAWPVGSSERGNDLSAIAHCVRYSDITDRIDKRISAERAAKKIKVEIPFVAVVRQGANGIHAAHALFTGVNRTNGQPMYKYNKHQEFKDTKLEEKNILAFFPRDEWAAATEYAQMIIMYFDTKKALQTKLFDAGGTETLRSYGYSRGRLSPEDANKKTVDLAKQLGTELSFATGEATT